MIQYLLDDEKTTSQLISSVQKDNLQKHEKLLNYLKEGIYFILCILL